MTTTPPITLITGGSRGLGAAMALALARDGHDIALTYRDAAAKADEVVTQIQALGRRALALQLDVADAAGFPAFVERLKQGLSTWGAGRLDGLVNNAGAGAHASFAETTPAQFDAMLAIHLKGPFFLTQALLPLLNDGARVLNISSGLARFSIPGYAAYAAMKGARRHRDGLRRRCGTRQRGAEPLRRVGHCAGPRRRGR